MEAWSSFAEIVMCILLEPWNDKRNRRRGRGKRPSMSMSKSTRAFGSKNPASGDDNGEKKES